MSSRLSTSRSSRSSDSLGGGQQLGPVLVGPGRRRRLRRLVDGRLGRGQRGAQVVADRGEQRGAHPVGLGQLAGLGGLLGQPLLAQRDRGLGGEGVQHAPVGGGEGTAAQDQREVVVDRHLGVAVVGARRRARRRRWRRPASVPGRAGGPGVVAASGRRSSRVTESARTSPAPGPAAPAAAVSPRSTLPARVDSVSASALARAASRVRRAARSTTALTADRDQRRRPAGRGCSPRSAMVNGAAAG